jgi:putative ABC transport system substrate-binding protein
MAAFRQGLKETGFVEGQNVAVEYRWADGQFRRLPSLAAELIEHRVAIIVTTGGSSAALAAKARTSTIPIVFSTGGDPVKDGLVPSLSRPGGNLTGASFLTLELEAKRLQLLRELVPDTTVVGFLSFAGGDASAVDARAAVEAAAAAIGLKLVIVEAGGGGFEPAFASLARQGAGALLVAANTFFNSRRDQIIALAARDRLPAIYQLRDFAEAGGLISYGANNADAYRQVGVYAGRILKGAKPAELPVVLPTRFELVINLRTVKALGLSVPQTLLVAADEVIE